MPAALMARVFDTQANQNFDSTFERFPVRIGRNQLNDLHIDRPYVSQFHAAIDLRDRQIFVRDLGSTNGTLVGGRRLARDTPVDVTKTPEITIGPTVIRFAVVEAAPKKREEPTEGTFLDFSNEANAVAALSLREKRVAPGAEDAYVRHVIPYIDAYRAAWAPVYQIIYDHLTRLPPELRQNYIRRLGQDHPSITGEADFKKVSQYYGVDARTLTGEVGPPEAALAALNDLARTLAPTIQSLDDVGSILVFARRLRDTMEVFLKCFVSLRDGYQEFEAEVLARDRTDGDDRVAAAKDAKELGTVLLTVAGGPEAAHQLYDIFVEVMSHQVALLNGVMEGVKSLLVKLSPREIEEELEKKGKKGGLFSSKYEGLWKLYERRHGDYSGEDKETFLIIFGPQFSRAYAATADEDYKGPARSPGNKR
jgi:type VI secretion system protein ImpI